MQEVTEPEPIRDDITDQLKALGQQLKQSNKAKKKPNTFSPFCAWILDVHHVVLQSMIPGMEMDTARLSGLIQQYESEIETLPCDLKQGSDARHTLLKQKIQVQDKAYEMIATAVVQSWDRVHRLKQDYEKRNQHRNINTDNTALRWVQWVNTNVPGPNNKTRQVFREEDDEVPSSVESTYLESHAAATAALKALDEVRRSMNEFWTSADINTPLDTMETLRQQETNLMQAAVEAVQYRTVARHRMLEEKHRRLLPNLPMEDEGVDMEDIELLKAQILGTINDEKLRRKAFRYQEVREMIMNAVMYETSRIQSAVSTLYQSMLVQVQACNDDLNVVEQHLARQKKDVPALPDCEHSMELKRRQAVFRIVKSHSFV
jgi:hypothetical protein